MRARTWIARVLGAVLVVVAFVVALAFGALLHLSSPPARRLIEAQLGPALEGVVAGTIVIDRIEQVGLLGVRGIDARLLHPDGGEVARIHDIDVTLGVIDLVRSALGDEGPIVVRVDTLHIGAVDLSVASDAAGSMRLTEALATEEGPAEPDGRAVALALPSIHVAHAWVHGAMQQAELDVDADLDRIDASLSLEADVLTLDVAGLEVTTRAMPRGADVSAKVRASLVLPPDGPITAKAAFDGTIAGAAVRAEGGIEGDVVKGELAVPTISPALVQRFVPDAPLAADASLHATVSGTLPALHVDALVAARSATIEVDADIVTAPALSATVEVRGRRLDASIAGGPVSAIDLDARAVVDLAGAPRGTFHLTTSAGVVADLGVPAVTLDGSFEDKAFAAHGRVDEPSLPIDVRVALAGSRATFAVDLEDGDLGALARRGAPLSGRATVHASGSADLDASSIDATATVTARGLAAAGVRASTATVSVAVQGPFADPAVQARVTASGIDAGLPAPVSVRATIAGTALAPIVEADLASDGLPAANVRTSLDLHGGVRVGATTVLLVQDDVTATVRVGPLDLRAGAPTAIDVAIDGLGSPIALSLARTRDGDRVVARAQRVSLPRVATLTGSLYRVTAGDAAIDADVTITSLGATGRVVAHVTRARARLLGDRDASADVDVTLLGRRAMLNAAVALAGVGRASLESRNLAELGGSPLDPLAWKRAEGAVAFESDIDLAELATVLPVWLLPVEGVSGKVSIGALVDRPRLAEDPALDLSVATEGFTMTVADPPLDLRAIDGRLQVRCGGTSPYAAVEAWAFDAAGTLARVEVATDTACLSLVDLVGYRARLAALPFQVRATVPRRPLASLPVVLGAPPLPGDIALTLTAEGPLTAPRVAVTGGAYQIAADDREGAPRFDVDLAGSYAASRAEATIGVAWKTRELLAANVEVTAPLGDLVLHPDAAIPWKGSADVDLLEVPLDELRALTGRDLRGTARGHVALRGLHDDAHLDGRIDIAGLVVDGVPFGAASVEAKLEDGSATAHVDLAQPGGHLRADAKTGLVWGAQVVPDVDLSGPIAIDIDAKKVRLRPLQPLVASSFDQLDGLLDGHLRITSGEGKQAAEGALSLREGRFQPTGSTPFEDVRARVSVDAQGGVTLEGVHAKSGNGEVTAWGKARLDGEGLRDASVTVHIADETALPLVVEGAEVATISGDIEAKVARQGAHDLRADVKVPRLRIELPQQLPGTVQSLEPPEHIRIGTMRRGRFVPEPKPDDDEAPEATKSASALSFHVALPDVEVKQGSDLAVRLHGAPRVVLRDGVAITGQVVIDGGTIDIKGRLFTLESGTITFAGASDNPDIVLTAKWRAPDGTLVYADFVGPLKTGKVTLRSDPGRPNHEILALILFGRAGGTLGDGGGADSETAATGAAGDFAARALSRAFADKTDIEIKARVDTSTASSPRTEFEVQIARDLSVQIATVLGQPLPGQTPDRNYVTLAWALSHAWSVETTVGDQGSTLLDLVWERLY